MMIDIFLFLKIKKHLSYSITLLMEFYIKGSINYVFQKKGNLTFIEAKFSYGIETSF